MPLPAFRTLRRAVLTRCLVIVLVTLVVTPFTAPFAAVDVLDVVAGAHDDEKPGIDGPSALVVVAPIIGDQAFALHPCSTRDLACAHTATGTGRPLVLRI